MSYQLNFHELVPYLPELGQGLLVTLELTLYATVGGILLGTLGAAARVSRSRPIRLFAGIYVELIRNTPFIVIVQLFFIFFGLPAAPSEEKVYGAAHNICNILHIHNQQNFAYSFCIFKKKKKRGLQKY